MSYELDFDYEGLMEVVEERYGEESSTEDDVLEALSEFSGEPVYRLEDRLESTRKVKE